MSEQQTKEETEIVSRITNAKSGMVSHAMDETCPTASGTINIESSLSDGAIDERKDTQTRHPMSGWSDAPRGSCRSDLEKRKEGSGGIPPRAGQKRDCPLPISLWQRYTKGIVRGYDIKANGRRVRGEGLLSLNAHCLISL